MISREQAISQGLNRYTNNATCRNGHVAEKYVRDNYCCECKRIGEIRNKNRRAQQSKQYYSKSRDVIISKVTIYASNNAEKIASNQKLWRTANAEKIRKYRKMNSGLYAFHAAKRRKLVKQATPPWADHEAIKLIYITAANLTKETGISYEVDHIIPIASDLICGLHCSSNLQIITKEENIKKSNKFKPISY